MAVAEVEMEPNYEYEQVDTNSNNRRSKNRRQSMSHDEQKQRRASIKAIMADTSITAHERRLSIQSLMDGRNIISRTSSMGTGNASVVSMIGNSSTAGTSSVGSLSDADISYGYGDGATDDGDEVSMGGSAVVIFGESTTAASASAAEDNNDIFGNGFVCMPVCTENTKRAELLRPPCNHYDRNCTMIAPCCGAAFGCRICHDECPVLPPLLIAKKAQASSLNNRRRYSRSVSMSHTAELQQEQHHDTHHTIDRFGVKEIICRKCYTKQSSKTNECVNCGIPFGEYHCSICNLWMSNDEKPYHCPDCGFCRVGGAENFQHCHDCGMCIDKTLFASHNCKSGKYKSNCPVCQEHLFDSRQASHEMPCGHTIHWECYQQLAKHDSRCPVCKKTTESKERMAPTWEAMAEAIAMQPIPPDLAQVVNISCIDCEKSENGRAWHFLGVQCRNCSSFNTVVDRIVMTGEEASDFLEAMQTRNDLLAVDDDNYNITDNNEGEGNNGSSNTNESRIYRRRINRRRSMF